METSSQAVKPADSAAAALVAALLVTDAAGVAVQGVPLSMVTLAALAVVLAAGRASFRAPAWLQAAFLATFCFGMMPLPPQHFAAGARQAVKVLAAFGAAWVVIESLSPAARRMAGTALAVLGVAAAAAAAAARCAGAPLPLSDARLAFIAAVSLPFLVDRLLGLKLGLALVPLAVLLDALALRNGGLLLCGIAGAVLTLALRKERRPWEAALVAVPLIAGLAIAGPSTWDTLAPRRAATGNLKRLYLEYKALPSAVADSPIIGHGLGRYKDVIHGFFTSFPDPDDYKIVPDTNSTYAVIAVESGLPAALLLAVLVGGLAVQSALAARKDPAAAPAAGAALALLLGGAFTVVFTRNTAMAAACAAGLAGTALPRPASRGVFAYRTAVVGVVAAICFAAAALGHRQQEDPAGRGLEVIEAGRGAQAAYWLIEAEATSRAPDGVMVVQDANDASGNRVLAVPLGAGKENGTAAYSLPAIPAGSYTIWVRAHWTDGCSNSIGCVIGEAHIKISDELFKQWHWVGSSQQVSLPGGPVEMILLSLEDGIMIDQVLFTADRAFVPHGIRHSKSGSFEATTSAPPPAT